MLCGDRQLFMKFKFVELFKICNFGFLEIIAIQQCSPEFLYFPTSYVILILQKVLKVMFPFLIKIQLTITGESTKGVEVEII